MKTYKNLFHQIASFDNLLSASQNARKGKRFVPEVAAFEHNLEANLFQLQLELADKTYRPGPYRSFWILDPKRRMISAAPYRDRVIHHAFCKISAPLFERTFVYDSYANRIGKGTLAAVERFQHYSRKYTYVLKCDIQKFFPSIDHQVLKNELRWKIQCEDTLWLADLIIDNSNQQEANFQYFPGDDLFTPFERRKGLPIGNLTSQWWGNIYLNKFDHFVKEDLQVPGYIRYVDDFVLFHNDPKQLLVWEQALQLFLMRYRLKLHGAKTQVYKVSAGVPFLGFQIFPSYKVIRRVKRARSKRFIAKKWADCESGKISHDQLENGLNSWLGHIRQGQSMRLENQIFRYLRERGLSLFRHPNGSWRILV